MSSANLNFNLNLSPLCQCWEVCMCAGLKCTNHSAVSSLSLLYNCGKFSRIMYERATLNLNIMCRGEHKLVLQYLAQPYTGCAAKTSIWSSIYCVLNCASHGVKFLGSNLTDFSFYSSIYWLSKFWQLRFTHCIHFLLKSRIFLSCRQLSCNISPVTGSFFFAHLLPL